MSFDLCHGRVTRLGLKVYPSRLAIDIIDHGDIEVYQKAGHYRPSDGQYYEGCLVVMYLTFSTV